jgi:hypothetical protein
MNESMSASSVGEKFWASIVAAAAGWLATVAATMPMQIYEICTNALGGLRPLLWSLGAGTLIWCIWTFIIAAGAWLLGGMPVALVVPEEWLLRHRWQAIAIGGVLAWLVVLVRFEVWDLLRPDHAFSPWLFTLYSLLLVVFAVATAAVYLRLRARTLRRS